MWFKMVFYPWNEEKVAKYICAFTSEYSNSDY